MLVLGCPSAGIKAHRVEELCPAWREAGDPSLAAVEKPNRNPMIYWELTRRSATIGNGCPWWSLTPKPEIVGIR